MIYDKFPLLDLQGGLPQGPPEQEQEPKAKATALRLLWCDAAGVRRCRAVPASQIEAAREVGVGLTRACMAAPVYMDTVVPDAGLVPVGEIRLMPVETSEVALPWASGHHMAPVEMHSSPGTAWECCPRSALRRALRELHKVQGLSLRVGFELEFLLLQTGTGPVQQGPGLPTLPLAPVDECPYSSSAAFDAQAAVLDEMVEALQSMGIEVTQYHAESAHGQYEIALGHLEALEAADMLLVAKETVGAIARRHGLAASFLPKYNANQAGSGCHCHFSLWRDGSSAMAAGDQSAASSSPILAHMSGPVPVLSSEAASFLAGVLQSLPALLPFTAPSTNSYKRLAPGTWVGVHYAWGWDNREVPLRLTCPPARKGDHPLQGLNAEYKCFDGTTNPYIGLAAIVAAGLQGLHSKAVLPTPLQENPAAMGQEALQALGAQRLPASLKDALSALESAVSFKAAASALLGPALLRAYLAVKYAEMEHGEGGENVASLYLKY